MNALRFVPLLVFAVAATAPAAFAAENDVSKAPYFLHELILDERAAAPRGDPAAPFTSRVFEARFPFNEVCPSWNVDTPDGSGFYVELRVGRQEGDIWSPFFYMGRWGRVPNVAEHVAKNEFGHVDVDYFVSDRTYDRLQYRIHFFPSADGKHPVLRRFGLCYSNTTGDRQLWERDHRAPKPVPPERWQRRLPVPFVTQATDVPDMSGLCSPTSVTMVMAYRGVQRVKEDVARTVFDAERRIYGNWPYNVQGVYEYGLPGYITRFHDWEEVKAEIARDQPIIISIRCGQDVIRNAPYDYSGGHLLVVVGFDKAGDVLVNDPAARSAEQGLATYKASELYECWMTRAGTAYVIEPRPGKMPVQVGRRD
jgi:hypothetical protein